MTPAPRTPAKTGRATPRGGGNKDRRRSADFVGYGTQASVLLAGLDAELAAHVATALTRYQRWLEDIDRPLPAGFAELVDTTNRVATNGQLRRSAHLARNHVGMLSLDNASELLSVSVRTIRRRVADGSLPVRRIGRRVLIHPRDLLAYVDEAA